MVKFGIIGAGVNAWSTALALIETYRDAEFVIRTESDDPSQVTSYGPPGIFRPDPSLLPNLTCCNNSDNQCLLTSSTNCPLTRWSLASRQRYWSLAASDKAVESGTLFHHTYRLYEAPKAREPYEAKMAGQSTLINDTDELQAMGFSSSFQSAYSYVTCLIEPRYYLPYLRETVGSKCNKPVQLLTGPSNALSSLDAVRQWALADKLEAVFNCSGLGSALLCQDRHIIPVRGNLVRVSAPWLKFGFMAPNMTHAYSGRDNVIMGGFLDRLPSPLSPDFASCHLRSSRDARAGIFRRIAATWSGPLTKAHVVEEWAGMRPFRPIVRLELNWLASADSNEQGRLVPIIHNYGHGSMGIALSWGCALDAVQLIEHAFSASRINHCDLQAVGLDKLPQLDVKV